MEDLDCENISPNHSGDRVDLHHGTGTPARVCGYHADRINLDSSLWPRVAPDPIVIEGPALTQLLADIFHEDEANREVRKLSLSVRREGIAFKVNEGMWTPTLATN